MSFVIAAPETLVRAASDLANIGSTLGAANAAALGPTTELLAAGADEVSAAIASLFAAHGQAYQAVSAQMSAFHAQFVQTFTAGAGAYASAEAAAAAPLEGLLNIVNTPTQLLLGRPLIGNGANGAPGTGQAGGAGGLLYGNGGAGGSGAAGLPGPRRPVGAVADQRAPQQRHGRRVDRTQQLLLDVGGLGAGIRACRAREGLHDLLVKRRRLSSQRLIGLRVAAKQRRHGGGHLIGTGGQHTRRGGRGRSIGRADRRADACQIRRRRAQHFRLCKQKRHDRPPESCGYEQTCRDRAA